MATAFAPRYTGKLILVPAVITLAVTLLRLVGELSRWSPVFFNREAGGPLSIVGIVWLVPIFGIYFAVRLARMGRGPSRRGRAVGFALAGLAAFPALYVVAVKLGPSPLARIAMINLASAVAAAIAYRGWPALGKTELLYGLAARVPVAIIMLVAMNAHWGTHYELGPPGLPDMGVLTLWLWIGLLPQLVFWISFTVLVGTLFGSLAALAVRPAPAAPSTVPA